MEEKTIYTLTREAYLLGYGKASSHIWEACCLRFGVGGTPEAKGAYEQIMKVFIKELQPLPIRRIMRNDMDNQRDTTEYKNLALWKEDGKYVIRKGAYRVGCCVDRLTKKDLIKLRDFINLELCKDKRWREVNEHKRLVVGSKKLDKKYEKRKK